MNIEYPRFANATFLNSSTKSDEVDTWMFLKKQEFSHDYYDDKKMFK